MLSCGALGSLFISAVLFFIPLWDGKAKCLCTETACWQFTLIFMILF